MTPSTGRRLTLDCGVRTVCMLVMKLNVCFLFQRLLHLYWARWKGVWWAEVCVAAGQTGDTGWVKQVILCMKGGHQILKGSGLCLSQVWMYSRLYRTMDRFHKPEILEAAKAGVYKCEACFCYFHLLSFFSVSPFYFFHWTEKIGLIILFYTPAHHADRCFLLRLVSVSYKEGVWCHYRPACSSSSTAWWPLLRFSSSSFILNTSLFKFNYIFFKWPSPVFRVHPIETNMNTNNGGIKIKQNKQLTVYFSA